MPLIEPGRKAPAFSLPDQDGKPHRLADYAGRPLIQAAVLGGSVLDVASKARFARKHKLNCPRLADPEHEVAEKYGAWQKKSLYGRTYMGVARMTYLIGPIGRVARRGDDVKVDGHAALVLRAVDEL